MTSVGMLRVADIRGTPPIAPGFSAALASSAAPLARRRCRRPSRARVRAGGCGRSTSSRVVFRTTVRTRTDADALSAEDDAVEEVTDVGELRLVDRVARAGDAEPGVVRLLERLGCRPARLCDLRRLQRPRSGSRPRAQVDPGVVSTRCRGGTARARRAAPRARRPRPELGEARTRFLASKADAGEIDVLGATSPRPHLRYCLRVEPKPAVPRRRPG